MTVMDKANRHTPGPWHIACVWAHDENVVYSGTLAIAHVCRKRGWGKYERTLEEWQANAQLIASAPRLLEAARAVINSSDYDDGRPLIKALRAAVERAEKSASS